MIHKIARFSLSALNRCEMMVVCAFASIWIKANNTDLAVHTHIHIVYNIHLSTVKHHLSLYFLLNIVCSILMLYTIPYLCCCTYNVYCTILYIIHEFHFLSYTLYVLVFVFVSTFSILILHEKFIWLINSNNWRIDICAQCLLRICWSYVNDLNGFPFFREHPIKMSINAKNQNRFLWK